MGRLKHQGRTALIMLSVLGMFTIGFALSPNVPVSCIMLFLAGAALMSVFSTVTSLVQLIVPDHMRGRVMSVYNLALRGGGPVGNLLVGGILIPHFAAPHAFALLGILEIVLAAYFLLVNRRVAVL
jgi:MFS family permease